MEQIFTLGSLSFGQEGIVKFNPDEVTEIPANFLITLENQRLEHLTYGDGFLWVGIDRLNKFDPITGTFLGDFELPGSAADLYFNGKFWSCDENDNSIKVYYQAAVGVDEENVGQFPTDYSLSQNYPNPFNPSQR